VSNGEPLRLAAKAWFALVALVACTGLVLDLLGHDRLGAIVGLPSYVAGAATALTVLARRLRADGRRVGEPWLLLLIWLATGVVWVTGTTLVMLASDGLHLQMVNLVHLSSVPLLVAALLRLPAPPPERHSHLRGALDAAAAALALLVVTWDYVVPDAGTLPDGLSLLHSISLMANVGLGTVAITAIARGRRPGGLPFPQLVALSAAVALGAAADAFASRMVAQEMWGPSGAYLAGLTLSAVLVAYGARRVLPVAESERGAALRERVAVLAPFAPLVVAGVAVLGAVVVRMPLSYVTAGFLLALIVVLLASAVMARLDSLAVARTMDRLVTARTVDLGMREKWFRSLVQNSSDVITVVDDRGVVLYQTPAVTRILGHDPSLLVGTRFTGLLRPADGRRLENVIAEVALHPGTSRTMEFPVWHKSGGWCDTETTITSLLDDPDIRGIVLNTRDVSERRRLQEQLTRQAYSDGLTGLANRALFRSRVEKELAAQLDPATVAVLFLDLNGFKSVNDTQGHHVGDELLTLVAKRLLNSVRPGDVVARLGGDEFAILVGGEEAEQGAIWVAERIRRVLGAPFILDGREVPLGASIGIAVNDSGDEDADQLLRNADLAMYRAKARREAGFVRFEAAMHDALLARVKAESDLRAAVSRGDLVLHYQPIVDLAAGCVVGVEALVRWAHAERGLVSPGEFIDLAEETGLVEEIGAWAIEETCRQGVRWQHYAPPGSVFRVAVNVSPRQLSASLPRMVHDALTSTGLPGSALTLEITEGVLIDRTEEVLALLKRVKTLGARIAVDDFGTGYSSLSYLARFPVDILKIDKTFVQHVGTDCEPGRAELAKTIVSIGATLGLTTVAEGIETKAQRDVMASLGCTLGQGYFFARALPADEVDALLALAEIPAPQAG
jgi:diguanylate cyclase (GGDEF)-like protein/PAS domain S-box-containing protein